MTGLVLGTGCGGAAPSVAPSPGTLTSTAPQGPLDYVPAAGLRWLVTARLRRIFADPELAGAISSVVPRARLEAFAAVTAVELSSVVQAAAAGYDLGTLYAARLATGDGARVRARFEERLTEGAIVKHPRPNLYRIAGTRAETPRALVTVDDRLLIAAVGDPTLARIAEAYAERRLKSPTALAGVSLSTLPAPPSDALVVFYAPGPFSGAWERAAGGLLAPALAVSVTVQHSGRGMLRVEIVVTGDWPEDGVDGRMHAAWTEVSESSTGRLFGLEQAKNVKSVAGLHQLTWSLDLPLAPLVAGLRAATVANVSEIFDLHVAEPTGSPASR